MQVFGRRRDQSLLLNCLFNLAQHCRYVRSTRLRFRAHRLHAFRSSDGVYKIFAKSSFVWFPIHGIQKGDSARELLYQVGERSVSLDGMQFSIDHDNLALQYLLYDRALHRLGLATGRD